MTRAYEDGLDVLGDGFDFSSILNMFTGGMGGGMLSSGSGGAGGKKLTTEEAVKKAVEEEKRREAQARNRVLLYTALGLAGACVVGAGAYLIARKK